MMSTSRQLGALRRKQVTMPSGKRAPAARAGDTFIASIVLIALIAGWILSVVSIREVTLRLDSLITATARWT
jgi:hypothetical protein